MVDDDSQITLDIVLADHDLLKNFTNVENAMINFLRYQNIKMYHKTFADVYNFKHAYPRLNFRHLIMPNGTLVGEIPVNEMRFNNKTVTYPMQLKGRKDGQHAYHTKHGYLF